MATGNGSRNDCGDPKAAAVIVDAGEGGLASTYLDLL